MKQRLFVLLFLTGFVPCLESVNSQYFLILEEKTWTDAQAYCRANYDDLATIAGWSDLDKIKAEAQAHKFISYAWIGLYTNTSAWRWSLGNQSLGNMTDWYTYPPNSEYNEPNNANGHEECCAFNPLGWFDRSCGEQFGFVCFDNQKKGTGKYIYYSTPLTWNAAQSYCRQYHTDLTSSRDATENSIIMNTIPQNNSFNWFGLFRNSWMWSDGNNSTFMVWAQHQPKGNENCVNIRNSRGYNSPCSDVLPFFCHAVAYPRKRQIIRMKVRSDQDVNNPAVLLAILQKIQQKMNDHGIANTTLKWRETLDGEVFHKEKENTTTSRTNTTCDL
ncbi:macrophage mannose receptor 1 [Ictalurus punctatus]|uniref:Macrophage mannose receptor 1 n=1 Tax=Ictalurus punctatus TaxID=7998 RepID=A0A2D0PJN8_ICTPU|nr:macrophage mannose receptor 1 [Ictalurus punctatus]